MSNGTYSFLLLKSIYQPMAAFEGLSKVDPSPINIMLRYSI